MRNLAKREIIFGLFLIMILGIIFNKNLGNSSANEFKNQFLILDYTPFRNSDNVEDLKVKVLIPERIVRTKNCETLYSWQEKAFLEPLGKGICPWKNPNDKAEINLGEVKFFVPLEYLIFNGVGSRSDNSNGLFRLQYVYPEMRSKSKYLDIVSEINVEVKLIDQSFKAIFNEIKLSKSKSLSNPKNEDNEMYQLNPLERIFDLGIYYNNGYEFVKFYGDDYYIECSDGEYKNVCRAFIWNEKFYADYQFNGSMVKNHQDIKNKIQKLLISYQQQQAHQKRKRCKNH